MGWRRLTKALRRTLKSAGAFGELATYTPQGGSPVEIRVIFRRTHIELDPEGVPVTSTTPNIKVDLDDLPVEPEQGDQVVYGGAEFRVSEVQVDGNGGAKLLMHLGA
jgi:hypothetical protein